MHIELKEQIKAQKTQIVKLTEHNKCYKETIEHLESQLKYTTADLSKASISLKHNSQTKDLLQLQGLI